MARRHRPRPFRRRPSGHVVDYTRTPDGRVAAVKTRTTAASTPANLATNLAYKPFGPLTALTYGNGLALTRAYDQNYWLTGISLAGGSALLDLAIARDPNGNVAAVTDNLATVRNAAYTYTDADRLATATGVWGTDAYTWDANGNRTRADRTIAATTASDVATIPATSNRQTEVRSATGTLAKTFTFRPGGDVATMVPPVNANKLTYTYDARGRLLTVKLGNSNTPIATYGYDFAQHRVASRDGASAQVHYLFDDEGRLLAEYDALSNNLLREYAWLDDTPLAMATGAVASPAWSYIHTGNLGEPVLLTNAAGAMTTSVTRDPWGNPILIAGTNPLALGYPGQWKDLAGGLWHNHNRDYDPTLGRYTEADPIGLAGGANLYGYVGGNPVNLVDPEGLERALPRPWGIPVPVPGTIPNPNGQSAGSWAGDVARDLQSKLVRFIRNCFDGGAGESEPERCRKVVKRCQEICNNRYAEDRNKLPGVGNNWSGRVRRCVRECAEAHGCKNY